MEAAFEQYSRIADSEEEVISPSGLYKLETSLYGKGKEIHWQYSRGIVSKIPGRKIIADVKRNIDHFWHTWVDHPNGNEYLLCGEDYQGYSVVNLTQETYQVYFPDEGYKGIGFCWVGAYPSPDKLMLAVYGCFWACPYDIVFYDFRQPDNLPYEELGRISELNTCEGWLDNETFVLTKSVEFRKSDGLPYEQLSEEEQDVLDTDRHLADFRTEKIHAKRPLPESVS